MISIVVSSFNQGRFLGETLESLATNGYPRLQVVIQDAGSTDNSIAIARRYEDQLPEIFKLFIEKDRGQAHAINLGFEKSRGEILGFLNADDTLFPGCLHQVAKEIDPARGRLIVMGRCLFTGEGAPYVGIEHPSEFIDHFHQLAIWRTGINTIPQPSVFWHRQVWNRCGLLDESQRHVLDYDLFCRFSRFYRFHKVDALWSTYRIHSESKTFSRTEQEVLEMCIAVSRKYWGACWEPLRWHCELSYRLHNPKSYENARHHASKAEEAFRSRNYVHAAAKTLRTALASPSLAFHRLIYPFFLNRLVPVLRPALFFQGTIVNGGNVTGEGGRLGDRWIGPAYEERFTVPEKTSSMMLHIRYVRPKKMLTKVTVMIDGEVKAKHEYERATDEVISVPIADKRRREVCLKIISSSAFVPQHYSECDDSRLLALMLNDVTFH
jgi:glycosyltransferase involved in cell wall biosynthesis